jgi:hypothetical protein
LSPAACVGRLLEELKVYSKVLRFGQQSRTWALLDRLNAYTTALGCVGDFLHFSRAVPRFEQHSLKPHHERGDRSIALRKADRRFSLDQTGFWTKVF